MASRTWQIVAVALMVAIAGSAAPRAAPPIEDVPTLFDQLDPEESVLLLVDYQPQFVFSTRSQSADTLVNNAQGLLKAARLFKVPVVTTTVTADAFGGPMIEELAPPRAQIIDRSVINAWHDARVRDAIRKTGRRTVIIAGLWTDNCVMLPALSARKKGYRVYFVTDASGDYDDESHERAVDRLVQAGAVPITWLPVMLEWQADWSRRETAGEVMNIMKQHAKGVGIGAQYLGAVRKNAG